MRARRKEALQPLVSFEVFAHSLIKALDQTVLLSGVLLLELREEPGGDAIDLGLEFERVLSLLNVVK